MFTNCPLIFPNLCYFMLLGPLFNKEYKLIIYWWTVCVLTHSQSSIYGPQYIFTGYNHDCIGVIFQGYKFSWFHPEIHKEIILQIMLLAWSNFAEGKSFTDDNFREFSSPTKIIPVKYKVIHVHVHVLTLVDNRSSCSNLMW